MSNTKKIAVRRNSPLKGMSKMKVQNIPRVRRYLEDAEIDGVNVGIECAENFRALKHAYVPLHTYSQLSTKDQKKYDNILIAATHFPKVRSLVEMAQELQEDIPYDRR